MADEKQLRIVRSALDSLGESLEREYARSSILTEADVHVAVVEHLKRELRYRDEAWIVGANHEINARRPDVACYYAPLDYDGFRSDYLESEKSLVAAVEIKWANSLQNDLIKLSELQGEHNDQILAWMVYGNHFDSGIHLKNAEGCKQSELKIQQWANENNERRGFTIVRSGAIAGHGGHSDRLRAMRDHWWVNDKTAISNRDARNAPGSGGALGGG